MSHCVPVYVFFLACVSVSVTEWVSSEISLGVSLGETADCDRAAEGDEVIRRYRPDKESRC